MGGYFPSLPIIASLQMIGSSLCPPHHTKVLMGWGGSFPGLICTLREEHKWVDRVVLPFTLTFPICSSCNFFLLLTRPIFSTDHAFGIIVENPSKDSFKSPNEAQLLTSLLTDTVSDDLFGGIRQWCGEYHHRSEPACVPLFSCVVWFKRLFDISKLISRSCESCYGCISLQCVLLGAVEVGLKNCSIFVGRKDSTARRSEMLMSRMT